MNVVVAGEYKGKAIVFIGTAGKSIGIATSLLKRKEWIPLNKDTIEKYEVIHDEPMKPTPKRELRISVDFKDGKRSLIQVEERFYKMLMNDCY